MNTKRAICILFALVLMIGAVGCGRDDNNSSVPQGQDEISLGGAETGNSMDENNIDETETLGSGAEFGDENVQIDVQLSKEGYTLLEQMEMSVTVTNISDKPIVYVHGSGSNTVPDALDIGLDRFSALFRPFMQTQDYNLRTLEPGESATFETPYAPYAPLNNDTIVEPGWDLDLFRGDEFEPLEHGEYEGTIRFTYYLSDEDEVDVAFDLVDNQEPITIEGSFRTNLIDDDNDLDADASVGTELGGDTSDAQ